MKFIFTLLIFYLTCLPAHSLVNLRNGSYFEKWVDYIDPQVGIDLRIERYYSSRSLFDGIFGYGWCSSLETKLVITSDGIINLVECGGGLEVTYYPSDFYVGSQDATINKIIADYKKNNKLSQGDLANLRTQLKFNSKMRFEYANKLHLVDVKKIKTKNNVFLAKSKGFEKITFDGRSYKRKKVDGSTEVFDEMGRLVKIINPAGQSLAISYLRKNLIKKIVSNDRKKQLTFTYNREGVLKKITNGNKLEVTYSFKGDNLVSVNNMWSKEYRFEYDQNHNMTKVSFPDNTFMTMNYDLDNDWIISYVNRKNCREEYKYEPLNGDKDHYYGKFSRYCLDPKTNRRTATTHGQHEFWYKKFAFSKGKYLHQVSETYQNDRKLAVFHPYFGKPNKLEHNQISTYYYYLNNGLVAREETKEFKGREIFKWLKTKFNYNRKSLRIKSITQNELNKLGKTTQLKTFHYKYNKKGFLSGANQKNGKAIKLIYDQNGKLDRMSSPELRITYQVGVEKPVEIEQVKLGKVLITYAQNGEIETLESTGKRNIASSVIEKFVEMINRLGPMGKNLGI